MSGDVATVIVGLILIALFCLSALCFSVLGLMIVLFFMPMAAWWQWLVIGIIAVVAAAFIGADY
jgi:hypothetical protein